MLSIYLRSIGYCWALERSKWKISNYPSIVWFEALIANWMEKREYLKIVEVIDYANLCNTEDGKDIHAFLRPPERTSKHLRQQLSCNRS